MVIFPHKKSRIGCMVAVIIAVVLATGCVDSINSYSHPHNAMPYSDVHASVKVIFSNGDYQNSYQVLAVMIPTTWSVDACNFTGDYSGTMSHSEDFRQEFENVYPSDEKYRWEVFVSDNTLTYVNELDTFTFDITLTAGGAGVYWLDYRVGSCNDSKDTNSIYLVPQLGNVYVNIGKYPMTRNSTAVKIMDHSPTFGILDNSWSESVSMPFEKGRDGRFDARAYFIVDKTHLNIFVDDFGCDAGNDEKTFAIIFDSNNDGTFTENIDTSVCIEISGEYGHYSINKYNNKYDVRNWNKIDDADLGTEIYMGGSSILADAAVMATHLNSIPHQTFSLKIPLGEGIIDGNAVSIRYAAILYDTKYWNPSIEYSFLDAYDVRSYLPTGVDEGYMPTWGILRMGNAPANTWPISLALARSALEQTNTAWNCLEPHVACLSCEQETLDEIATYMQNATTLSVPLEVNANARDALALIEALIIKYDIDCHPN